jgi:hypothetical protein
MGPRGSLSSGRALRGPVDGDDNSKDARYFFSIETPDGPMLSWTPFGSLRS